jgi:tripartite-type tricarboxylate transporter receptor subunit TctC
MSVFGHWVMRTSLVIIALLAAPLTAVAQAQDYPNRLIKMMHGFPPGGNVDAIARIVTQEMSTGLGQPMIVEAKPGAVGSLAADVVARATPDGYTLLTVPSAHAVTGALYKTLKYRPLDDFDWISTVSFYPFVLCVRKDSKFRSLGDLMQAAGVKAEAVSFGSAGIGTIQHMIAELLANATKVKFLQLHYRGEAQASTGLLTGDIDFLISTPTVAVAQIASGEFRALAVTSRERWTQLPDVPTVGEAGVPGFEMMSWTGLATRAGTPPPIIARLNAEVRRAIAVPQVKSRLESLGGDVRAMTPDEMRALVAGQLALWARVAREQNIQVD